MIRIKTKQDLKNLKILLYYSESRAEGCNAIRTTYQVLTGKLFPDNLYKEIVSKCPLEKTVSEFIEICIRKREEINER